MDNIPFGVELSPTPVHTPFAEPIQYRVKLQKFSRTPSELTVQRISYEADVDRYFKAYENGASSCFPGSRRARDPNKPQDPEALERSQRRAKTKVRLLVTELGPSSLVTFTTRKVYTHDQLVRIWDGFTRLARQVEPDFRYVAVPEPHPSNPAHLHLHAAVRSKISRDTLRRLWHIALEGFEGRRVTATLRGSASPGNIDDQPIKGRDTLKRIRKIARYISKYITKDLIEKFNRKRYWPSKGINLADAQVFWLTAVSQADAIREACSAFGVWDNLVGAPAGKAFCPSDRVFWMPFQPGWGDTSDPPF